MAASSETPAPSVKPPVITPLMSSNSVRDRIVTPYRADVFETELRKHGLLKQHLPLVKSLRSGFDVGDFTPRLVSFSPRNHNSGVRNMDFIQEYIKEEVRLKRMSGPYTCAQVESLLGNKFVSSPLFVIEKAGSPGKFRLIEDRSWKDSDGLSVNDEIDTDKYLTKWGTAAEVAEIVATCPPGTQAAKLDIDSAFRNIPILPAHKPFLVIQSVPGEFYIDHVCPFGIASGTGVQGIVMDGIVDILAANGIKPSKKWVDDLAQFRMPTGRCADGSFVYAYDLNDLFAITTRLGVPWKLGKCFPYSSTLIYVGFLWNLQLRTVELPEEKRAKYHRKLVAFRAAARARPVSLGETSSIMGTLSHITFVYSYGRAYLTNLCSFMTSFASDSPTTKRAPTSVLSDLNWWNTALEERGSKRSLKPRTKLDLNIWVDASSDYGIGIIIGDKWCAYKLANNWNREGRNIGWAEMVAVELAVRYLDVMAIVRSDRDILIHSDNTGIIGAYNKGRSRNFQVNESIRRCNIICSSLNNRLKLEWVRSEDNLADALSRGKRPYNCASQLKPLADLPGELQNLLTYVSC